MKPAPPPAVLEETDFERFDALFRKVIAVPKVAITKANSKRTRSTKKHKRGR